MRFCFIRYASTSFGLSPDMEARRKEQIEHLAQTPNTSQTMQIHHIAAHTQNHFLFLFLKLQHLHMSAPSLSWFVGLAKLCNPVALADFLFSFSFFAAVTVIFSQSAEEKQRQRQEICPLSINKDKLQR